MRARSILLAVLPATIGLVIGVAFLLAGNTTAVRFTVSFGGLTAALGIVISAVILLVFFIRRQFTRNTARAHARGLQEQRESHRRFLSRLDHEMKNPLTAIRAAVAAEGSLAGATPSTHQSVIESQSRRLGNLVSDLRKLAELETVVLENEPVNLELLAADVVDVIREETSTIANGDRSIAVSFPQVPWPMPVVHGDSDLLFVALYNLVSNAVKYSGADSAIEIRGVEDEGWAIIEVADTGVGIPADEVDVVFDELARGRNVRGTPGSGLGLSLANTVIARHGGVVTVKSREGQGTSVRMRLPVRS